MANDFDELSQKAKRVAAEASEGLKEKLSSMKGLEDLDGMKEAAEGLAEDAAEFVRKYPVPSVLGALAAGFVIGAILTRRR